MVENLHENMKSSNSCKKVSKALLFLPRGLVVTLATGLKHSTFVKNVPCNIVDVLETIRAELNAPIPPRNHDENIADV